MGDATIDDPERFARSYLTFLHRRGVIFSFLFAFAFIISPQPLLDLYASALGMGGLMHKLRTLFRYSDVTRAVRYSSTYLRLQYTNLDVEILYQHLVYRQHLTPRV